jgi:uncharacterized coiled-coil DUF342 family protein
VLWMNFTTDELQEKGQELSNSVLEFSDVEAEKKTKMDEFKQFLDGIEGRIHRLSREIRAKGREVPTACVVRFHVPRTAFKQIVRLDTGELVREEQMSPQECQENLFESKEVDELKKLYDESEPHQPSA